MRIFITGIAGFVARHFMEMLATHQRQYTVLGIYNSRKPHFSEDAFPQIHTTFKQVNLTDKSKVKTAIQEFNPDYILHLASRSSVAYSWHQPGELVAENTRIFLNIIESLRELQSPCRMLSVGSAEEYGQVEASQLPLLETYCTNPVSPYGAARVLQHNLVSIYAKNFGLNLTHTRSFNHIGPYQNENFVIGSFIKQISMQLNNGSKNIQLVVGDIEVIRDFTDVRDVVQAYYQLLLHGKQGETYNVCSNKGYRLKDLIQLFAQLTDSEITCLRDPHNLRPSENKEIIGSYDKLHAETGWTPKISIEQSMTDLLDYWKEKVSAEAIHT